MTETTAIAKNAPSLLQTMAAKYQIDPMAFQACVKAACIKGDVSNEQFAAFMVCANKYDLNPLLKEIYAFPAKGGGITPIVSVDGWISLANRHPQYDGITFDDHIEDGKLVAITAHVWRKDRTHPVSVTEYMSECKRDTETWKQWSNRMLRNKAMIQGFRIAFGFAGIYDHDEAERIIDVEPIIDEQDETPTPPSGKVKVGRQEQEKADQV